MVVAFYFRLHLAYFPRPVVAIFARPEQWVEPHAANTIFVSDAYIKYAKPYAVQKVLDNI